ncbi:MAG: dephospho-CoA kinase [Acidobacteriota bacterium]|jgi:dephospho-CoA kinase|nr:dephospho-CoA kinase [Acidobacteriota bacterium]
MILRVGLTGGIASGKSTVARIFAGLGCLTIDADAIVARLYRPGEAGYQAIVRTYGREVLAPNGEIDRQKLADVAFVDDASAKRLNSLIHPLVIEEQTRLMDAEEARFPGRNRIAVIEATLLLESGGKQRFDRIVVVDAPPETQLARGEGRGMAAEEVARRIRHQMPREERLAQADYVIENRADERALEVATHGVFARLQQDLDAKKQGSRLRLP